jgi:hypothetical protein
MVQGLISIDDIHAIGFCDSDSDFVVQSCDSNSEFLFQSCEAGLTVTGIIDGDRSIQTSHVGGLLPFPLHLGNIPMTKFAMSSQFFEDTKSSTGIGDYMRSSVHHILTQTKNNIPSSELSDLRILYLSLYIC